MSCHLVARAKRRRPCSARKSRPPASLGMSLSDGTVLERFSVITKWYEKASRRLNADAISRPRTCQDGIGLIFDLCTAGLSAVCVCQRNNKLVIVNTSTARVYTVRRRDFRGWWFRTSNVRVSARLFLGFLCSVISNGDRHWGFKEK